MIITSILEREDEKIFNTCLIISTTGEIIGKYRKNHIPPIEAAFLESGKFDRQVFDTEFGKIGIVICYERHFPLMWMTNGLEGAEIVFNPSSEDENSFSERLWFVEGVNAAAANGFFTVNVNRTGTETFNDGSSFTYFGSNYVASPEGFRTPHLPKNVDGLLISEIDLGLCRKAKENFSFHGNQHLKYYADKLSFINFKAKT